MDDDQAALRFAAARPGQAALCTIVGIEGTFSRRLGAQLAVASDGTIVGSLSDGCLERELATQSLEARSSGDPRLLRYGQGSPILDFRLPCGSGLDVLIDPRPDESALAEAVSALDSRRRAVLPLPVTQPQLLQRRHYLPSLRLLLFGAGPEVDWLGQLSAGFGLSCEVAGPDRGLSLGRAPIGFGVDDWTAIVLLFHDHEWEKSILDWALGTSAFYIGAQGGAFTREARRAQLKAMGHSPAQADRVRCPIGLIPSARDARTLALSALADVVAAYEMLDR